MTTRPLNDTDLARIAPQPIDMKRKSLERLRSGHPPFTYRPLRSTLSDILNIQPELDLDPIPAAPWEAIEAKLSKLAKNDLEFEHNVRVALGLYQFACSGQIKGRKQEFFPLSMGAGRRVTLWEPMIVAIDEKPHAIFIEPRRSAGLTGEGRRFAFSMMHERIRAEDEDFSAIGLAILRFDAAATGPRSVVPYTETGVSLYSLEEMEQMVSETYMLWEEVCAGRKEETKRRAGGSGPLI